MPDSHTSVNDYLAALPDDLRATVLALREVVSDAAPSATEIVKWNSPSYTIDDNDVLTINVNPRGVVRLILHRGVAVAETKGAAHDFAGDPSGLLSWHSDIRASFVMDATSPRDALVAVVRAWVAG